MDEHRTLSPRCGRESKFLGLAQPSPWNLPVRGLLRLKNLTAQTPPPKIISPHLLPAITSCSIIRVISSAWTESTTNGAGEAAGGLGSRPSDLGIGDKAPARPAMPPSSEPEIRRPGTLRVSYYSLRDVSVPGPRPLIRGWGKCRVKPGCHWQSGAQARPDFSPSASGPIPPIVHARERSTRPPYSSDRSWPSILRLARR